MRLDAIPDVRSATFSDMSPMQGPGASSFAFAEGHPEKQTQASINYVAPDYFKTYGTPFLAGRDFSTRDEAGSAVAIINEAAAHDSFGNENPIGKHMNMRSRSALGPLSCSHRTHKNGCRMIQQRRKQRMLTFTFNPLGVVLGIMPWNFPFWQAFKSTIPAMLAGNTFILRHSNTCPGSALAIEESVVNAGLPEGTFRTIMSSHEVVGRLIESDIIQGVSLTGSVEAGKIIASQAGKNLKKCVLELGGSDPFIVCDDANVADAARIGAEARLLNSGQSCISAKRFIVVSRNAEEFTNKFIEEIENKKVGDPMDRSIDVGPLVNAEAVEKVDGQVKDALSKGAKVLLRGGPKSSKGSFLRTHGPVPCRQKHAGDERGGLWSSSAHLHR